MEQTALMTQMEDRKILTRISTDVDADIVMTKIIEKFQAHLRDDIIEDQIAAAMATHRRVKRVETQPVLA